MKIKRVIFLILVVLGAGFAGCKKKDRLTTSTFRFGITPPAARVLRTTTLTLTAYGSSAAGAVPVSPTWAVSPTSVGTINNSIGTSVVFTPVDFGTAVVTATFDGIQAQAELNVVSYIPGPTLFNVYSDDGLPAPSGASVADIIVGPGPVAISTSTDGYTPEGFEFQRTTSFDTNDFWGVTLDSNTVLAYRDLSAYEGTLKFAIRIHRDLASIAGGDHLQIQLRSSGGLDISVSLAGGGVYGFNRSDNDWQEIAIPIADFGGLNTAQIDIPFKVFAVALNSSLDFDVDAIRWEP